METIAAELPANEDAATADALPPDIYERLVRESFLRTAIIAPLSGAFAMLFGGLSWARTDNPWLLAWTVVALVIAASRLVLVRAFRLRPEAQPIEAWARQITTTSWLAALNTSLLALTFVFVADPMVHTLAGLVMFTCVPSAALPRARVPPNGGAWQFRLVLGALAAGLASIGNGSYLVIAGMVLLIAIMLPVFMRRYYVERVGALVADREKATLLIEVAAQKAEAEAASRAKSMFLASMSHELRTPLNAIIGFSDLIRMEAFGPLDNARYRTYVEDIATSGRHLLALINDVLDMSKIEVGRMVLVEEETDLAMLARGSCDSLRLQAAAAQVALVCEAQACPMIGDPQRIRQVLLNLLSNAIKYTRPDGRVVVTAAVDAAGATILRVKDDGVGIAPEHLDTVMEMFGQVDSEINRMKPGTGLGLPLSQRLVTLHGGTLTIESRQGEGTCVTVAFPPERTVASGGPARMACERPG